MIRDGGGLMQGYLRKTKIVIDVDASLFLPKISADPALAKNEHAANPSVPTE